MSIINVPFELEEVNDRDSRNCCNISPEYFMKILKSVENDSSTIYTCLV